MKYFVVVIAVCIQYLSFAQTELQFEKPPVFPECKTQDFSNLKTCFDNQVFKHVFNTFKVPEHILKDNYEGEVVVLFEVDDKGKFKVIYTDAIDDDLKNEAKRVFNELPNIQPGTYNGRAVFKQYSVAIKIPLVDQTLPIQPKVNPELTLEEKAKKEIDELTKNETNYDGKAFTSELNIPFTHQYYAKFDRAINVVGANSHTAVKPFLYNEVANYYDLKAANEKLKKADDTYLERKLFNEHFVQIQGKDYWFTVDPVFDLQVGKDADAEFNSTYNNTRGIFVQGGLGKKFNFSMSYFESQGRFADYVNRYSETLKAFGPDPAIVPGRGIGKRFKKNGYDYPVADAVLSYSPAKFANLQFGYGKNFIGDGYRSILLSDATSPLTYFKINTKFWKIKYTNTWMWAQDMRDEVVNNGAFLTKYIANHYLSWNVSKRLNLGFFESVIWTKNPNKDFDINYLNPLIFLRAIEFESGQDAGNALIGLSGKYKVNDNINVYTQFLIDEFSKSDIFGGEKSWKNKLGFQLGAKYYNAFKVKNLMLQAEYNQIRPYVYTHNTIRQNYAHANQPMAHLWGANFKEFILIGRYHYNRWFADGKIIFGKRGFDFNTEDDNLAYGGNIFTSENNRPFETGVEIGQGNTTNVFLGNLQAGYLINPATNLKLFADVTFRDFNPEEDTMQTFKNNTVWFTLGLRTDLFNWYFDF